MFHLETLLRCILDIPKRGRAKCASAQPNGEARELLETAERLAPSARVYHLLGRLYADLDQPDHAAAYLEKVVQADPALLDARAELGRVNFRAGKPELAVPELKRAASLDRSGDLHCLLYQAYAALSETRLATDALNQ